jgi:hypothetical protein
MRATIFSVLTVFLCFSKGVASEPLFNGFSFKSSFLTSNQSPINILIDQPRNFLSSVEKGKESVNSKYPVSSSLTETDSNDPEWEQMIATSISKMKGANNKFWIHFFAVCALCLMGIVTLGAIFFKVKKRYFS